jgi:hypothetical protein
MATNLDLCVSVRAVVSRSCENGDEDSEAQSESGVEPSVCCGEGQDSGQNGRAVCLGCGKLTPMIWWNS